MKKIIFIALIAAGFWHWKNNGFNHTSTPLDSNGKPTVLVFTFPDCGTPCDNTIAALKHRDVPFNEVVVNPNEPDHENYKQWQTYKERSFPLIVAGSSKVTDDSTSNLVELLAVNFNEQYLTSNEANYYKRHFDSNGEAKIVLYGTDWCPGCAALRKEMREENIDFVDIDVEKVTGSQKMLSTMEIGGYPAVWVGYRRVNGVTLNAVKKEL
jgi:glutaredoxin